MAQVMTLALAGAKRQLGAGEGGDSLRVGKPHGAESGFDPHTAYKDLDDTNFFGSVQLTYPDLLPLASQEHSVSPDHERGFGWWRERGLGVHECLAGGRVCFVPPPPSDTSQ